ncbi:vitamin K-dependent gamma-carboxylase-like [Ornithodoros turicata]|uniref:vitamin K-dependent gamma-carboxylase-like n=1 Tax=Ornithodoros turicata TaxID=34597 RepID=UPI00313908E1
MSSGSSYWKRGTLILSSWVSSCIIWLHTPCDPSNLAITRILFGTMMVLDQPAERGLSFVEERWGDPKECRFPLFEFIRPLSVEAMYTVHVVMLLGALGMATGMWFRRSCLAFVVPYWYLFLLEKSRWNNHSYLYGIFTMLLSTTGAHKLWSFDAGRKPNSWNTHVPKWNYLLLRSQVFLVYFIAGLKKINRDWTGGFSMSGLGRHWVFDTFRYLLSDEDVDFYIIHWGGFLFDLTVGFLMMSSITRATALLLSFLFNGMNSQMFRIGMFPYVMITLSPLFLNYDWPKQAIAASPAWAKKVLPRVTAAAQSVDCFYARKTEPRSSTKDAHRETSIPRKWKWTFLFLCLHWSIQLSLPYSHWLTKGYNTWTEGIYGYSWDMMVHNWRQVHAKATVFDSSTGETRFIDPSKFTASLRWYHQADMVKQFAHCVERRLRDDFGMKSVQLYVDVWMSLNGRFAQRMYDPTVDILKASWSPFKEVSWVLPVLTNLNDWRFDFEKIMKEVTNDSTLSNVNVEFVADFPGFSLVNYLDDKFQNVSLKVLSGTVSFRTQSDEVETVLQRGDAITVPTSEYHKVTPLKHSIACYVYVFTDNVRLDDNASPLNIGGQGNNTTAKQKKPNDIVYYFGEYVNQWKTSFQRLGGLFRELATSLNKSFGSLCTSCNA